MSRVRLVIASLGLLLAAWLRHETVRADEPLHIGQEEAASVSLVLLDAVVVDKQGRTVPGLTREDFELVAGGQTVPVDTLDVACLPEALDDARPVNRADRRPALPQTSEPRRIVLAFDYQHLPALVREDALLRAQEAFATGAATNDEWMVVALTGGLRLEQSWTRDPAQVRATLQRMDKDITLWNGNFAHLTADGFVGTLEALLETLGELPGAKALVLFSAMPEAPAESDFRRLAAAAATGRCTIFPVDARGLVPPINILGAG
jgi:VWFA-related protein